MHSRLKTIALSYNSMTERLGDPDVTSSPALLRSIMEERSKSEAVVNTFERYSSLSLELDNAKVIFREAIDVGDWEMREMVREEIVALEERIGGLVGEVSILLLPSDPLDVSVYFSSFKGTNCKTTMTHPSPLPFSGS